MSYICKVNNNTMATKDTYYLATMVKFEEISIEEWNAIPAEIFASDSGSCYKIYEGKVYRMANHWGGCASCYWPLVTLKFGHEMEYRKSAGVADLSSFKGNDLGYEKTICSPEFITISGFVRPNVNF